MFSFPWGPEIVFKEIWLLFSFSSIWNPPLWVWPLSLVWVDFLEWSLWLEELKLAVIVKVGFDFDIEKALSALFEVFEVWLFFWLSLFVFVFVFIVVVTWSWIWLSKVGKSQVKISGTGLVFVEDGKRGLMRKFCLLWRHILVDNCWLKIYNRVSTNYSLDGTAFYRKTYDVGQFTTIFSYLVSLAAHQ